MSHDPELTSPYDEIADLYDLEHSDHDDDIALIRNIVSVVGDPVVEFGCGSGRLLLPVARDGFAITGVDNSPAMLDRARRAILEADLADDISLVHGQMEKTLPLPAESFGVGIFSLNGLMHLRSQDLQIAALTEACRLIDPRGQLIIDLFNPTPEYLTHLGSHPHLEGKWATSDGNEVEKWTHRTVRASTQQIDTRIWYDAVDEPGLVRRRRSSFTLRYIHAAELTLMLQKAGFVEWQLYGTYDLDPFEDASDRLIVLAERTPS
jgi:ubiquinone/menaquinone biosynthesis C-methylase UbiE